MRLFAKRDRPHVPEVQTCTTADRGIIPPLHLSDQPHEMRLYRALRDQVPVIDAAIMKLIRLLGEFTIKCADNQAQTMMDRFVSQISVGGTGAGLHTFICSYFDQLLTCGRAVGEIVTFEDGGIAALYNAPDDAVTLRMGDSPVDVRIFPNDLCAKEIEHPELICLTLLNPQPGTLRGTSILSGLPFVSELLMKIFRCVGQNFERAGNVRYAVTYHPPAGTGDPPRARADRRKALYPAVFAGTVMVLDREDVLSAGGYPDVGAGVLPLAAHAGDRKDRADLSGFRAAGSRCQRGVEQYQPAG